ncbi:MAG: NPCBM/NEW2 domain-containing protein [Sedimentisphaerales bacterium]|nr:NPCBM/NEW2 domain-containing protein [Sedimentisphaerales bacterium]
MTKKTPLHHPYLVCACLLAACLSLSLAVAAPQENRETANAAGPDPAFWQWAPTPPAGWNSWDCFGATVTEAEVKANAEYLARHLKAYGWEYVVVDIQWYEPQSDGRNGRPYDYPRRPQTHIDEFGRPWPAPGKHPSSADGQGFKPLADYVHGLGLKFGVHLMRGIPRVAVETNTPVLGTSHRAQDIADRRSTCRWNPDMYGVDVGRAGGQEYYDSVFSLLAQWQVDYVKVDDLSRPYHQSEIEALRRSIDRSGRPMVLSTSPGETPLAAGDHVSGQANLWRISDDFWDEWRLLKSQFARLDAWTPWRGDGHFPDADMLPLGRIRARQADGWTRFTPTEQVTMMSLWAIARSPLMMGGHLPANDEFTLSLLTNEEVLAVNRHSRENRQWFRRDDLIAWTASDRRSADRYVALFNAQDAGPFDESLAVWKSPLLNRDAKPRCLPVDIPLAGARKLYLVVADAGDGIFCDHADWLEPLLIDEQEHATRLTERKWTRAAAGWGQIGIDRSISGRPLQVAQKGYEWGIGTHAFSLIEYDLPEGASRFQCQVALDDGGFNQDTEGATVQFLVFTRDPAPPAPAAAVIEIDPAEIGIAGSYAVRDLWRENDLDTFTGIYQTKLAPHASVLLRIRPIASDQ